MGFVTLVFTQESVSVTTALVTITSAPSLASSAVPDAYIGESTEPALGACEYLILQAISHLLTSDHRYNLVLSSWPNLVPGWELRPML